MISELSSNQNVNFDVTKCNELQNMEFDTTDDLNVESSSLVVLRNIEITPTGMYINYLYEILGTFSTTSISITKGMNIFRSTKRFKRDSPR